MDNNNNLIIVFDTETTGFSPIKNEIVQLSYILYDVDKQEVVYATKPGDDIVAITGNIQKSTSDVHGITKDMTLDKRPIKEHIDEFIYYCNQASQFVGHNIKFDIKMITGQINKIIKNQPETASQYRAFLEKFSMVGNELPDLAYCTMTESKGICAEILGVKQLKNKKLMEVHKLLFNQDVGGQLHNALVDISVTLRVYLKLTKNIDICINQSVFTRNTTEVTNNISICSLINPILLDTPVESVEYSGELLVSLNILEDGLEEEKIMVNTFAKEFVNNVKKQAMSNVMKNLIPMCTRITICKTIIKSGKRKGQECGRPVNIDNNEFCGYHKPKTNKVTPIINTNTTPTTKVATSFVSKLFDKFTRKNKVVPSGGSKKRKNKSKKR